MAERQPTESTLPDTAEQFHILVDSVEEYAIYMLDASGNVVTWNKGAQKIKGYRGDEIIGKNFACFYTAEDVGAGKPQRNLREAAELYLETLKPAELRRLNAKTILATLLEVAHG